jgi:hypothetical protein
LTDAEKKAREAEIRAEQVFAARLKFERLISRCNGLNPNGGSFKLVSDASEEGEFEPEELAMVPTEQLGGCLEYLEETQEVLATMIQEITEALDARME